LRCTLRAREPLISGQQSRNGNACSSITGYQIGDIFQDGNSGKNGGIFAGSGRECILHGRKAFEKVLQLLQMFGRFTIVSPNGTGMTVCVNLEVPQDILDSARLTAPELKLELALSLYAQGRLSIGKACELAGFSLWEFRQVLAARRITAHYDLEDLQDDITTAGRLAGL
jgi:predicted HTH domain antitoxin